MRSAIAFCSFLSFSVAVGCSSNDSNTNITDCGPNGTCPAGYTCSADNKCILSGGSVDGPTAGDAAPGAPDGQPSVDARPPADGPRPDAAPPDAPAPDAAPGTVTLTLGIGGSGGGTVSIVGGSFSCTAASCTTQVTQGSTITLMAAKTGASRFVSWSGDCSGTNATVMVTADAARSCSATFVARLTITSSTVGGTSTASVGDTSASADCSAGMCTVDLGDAVTFSVVTAAADRFVGWTGTGCTGHGLTAPLMLTPSANISCAAHFVDAASTSAPALGTLWPSPTGWTDENGNPPTMSVVAVPGATYECRTGRTKVAANSSSHVNNQPYHLCDGVAGATPVVLGTPVAADPSGTYQTQVRLHILDYVSATAPTAEYYAHETLNGAHVCTDAIQDADIFTAALMVTPSQQQLASTGAFGAGTVIDNPFVAISFINSVFDVWSVLGDPTPPSPNVVNVLSLRHRFAFNGAKDLLLVRRRFESSRRKTYEQSSSCKNGYAFGWRWFEYAGQVFGPPSPALAQRRIDCVALVLNAAGNGVCVELGRAGILVPAIYTNTGWEKLVSIDSFAPKYRGTCGKTNPAKCGFLLPE